MPRRSSPSRAARGPVPGALSAHATATAGNRNICIVLSPSHEIKVFADGVEMFSFRNARWHLLDVQAKYEMWERAVGNAALANACSRRRSIWPTRGRARCSSCFAIPQRRCRCSSRRATGSMRRAEAGDVPDRVQLLHMLRGRSGRARSAVLAGLARTDGATVMDATGRLLAVGAILLHSEPVEPHSMLAVEGARDGGDGSGPLPPCSRSARTG